MTIVQPLFLRPEDAPALPDGWSYLTTEAASTQLKPGPLFDKKTAKTNGGTPILPQGEESYVGFHDERPGVVASDDSPVVIFANHTCAMRLMKIPFSCIQNIFPKVGRSGVTDTKYFYYASRGRATLTDYKGHHPVFRSALIPVPPLECQRRIASVLSAYDDLIETNRRRVVLLEDMARSLFEEWFVRFRFPEHEDVELVNQPDGPLPQGWSHATLGELADIQWGDTSKTKKAYTSEGYTAYSASGPDGLMPKYDYDRTGVVLSAIGAKCGGTWLAREQWSCIKNTMRFWAIAGTVSTEYLFVALSDPDKWPKRGAAQPFISLGDARKIKLVRPDAVTSERFGTFASTAFATADNLTCQNERLSASRDLLLPRLISGQLSVAAAERELSEAA